ncbi:SMI1/KNR4 family protein [Actinoplanes lobatus]|uniref:SMI1/KNR4 family protein n=1 Tax=Actinoplanes lobatus TaxID=113568 RepID=UPI00165FD92C|nr:SMI1/KNR4 family protein [Actinoplanes lobatus]
MVPLCRGGGCTAAGLRAAVYGGVVINSDWSDVRARLAALSIHPNSGSIFGANDHQWRLEPPVTDHELAELESQLGIELPGEYRTFLLHVGRGGAGPAYGLFPLRRVEGRWHWEGDGADLTDLATLSQPFPRTEAFNPADGLPDPPDEDDFDSEEQFNEAEDVYWRHHDDVTCAPEHSIGLLYLCHLGCALREVLVISGPARGQMWADDTADDGGFRPLCEPDGRPTGFAHWYRRWLKEAEDQIQHR